MRKGNFALGALIGIVAGVVAGVLTAPKSGKDTRSDIKGKAAELKQAAAKRVDDVKDKVDTYTHPNEHADDGAKKGFFAAHTKNKR